MKVMQDVFMFHLRCLEMNLFDMQVDFDLFDF